MVVKRLKLNGDHMQRAVAIANVGKHDANINVMFHGEMKEFFHREVVRLREKYSDILRDSIPEGHVMKTKPARIRFNQEVTKLYCAMKARRVPLHQEDAAKKIINDLLIQGIIKKQENNYSDWCSPATFVPKRPAGLRS